MYIILSTCYIWQTLLSFLALCFPTEFWGYLSDSVPKASGLVMTFNDITSVSFSIAMTGLGHGIQFWPMMWQGQTPGASRRDCPSWEDRGWEEIFSLLLSFHAAAANWLRMAKQHQGFTLRGGVCIFTLLWSNHGTASSSSLLTNNKYVQVT